MKIDEETNERIRHVAHRRECLEECCAETEPSEYPIIEFNNP